MDYLLRLKLRASILTVGISLWFLVRLWREGELFGTQELVFSAWFIVAVAIQVFARTSNVWIAGLLAQVALAIVLVLKQGIDDIY